MVRARVGSMVAAVVSLALVGCDQLLVVEADAPRACVKVSDLELAEGTSVPAEFAAQQQSLVGTFRKRIELKLDPRLTPKDEDSTVTAAFISAELIPRTGSALDFADSVEVWAIDSQPQQELSTLLAGYTDEGANPESLKLEPLSPVDVMPFVHDDTLALELVITGTAPVDAVQVDAVACFAVAAHVEVNR